MHWGPLLDRTHQVWKLHVMIGGVLVACAIEVIPFLHASTAKETAIYGGLGAFVAFISLLIAFAGIRCPVCGSRWVWRAATQSHVNYLAWLRAQRACPDCGSAGFNAP